MKNLKRKNKNDEIDPLDNDLSELLQKGDWRPMSFEIRRKNKTISLRLSEELLKAVKETAKKIGLDYQKFIRLVLEDSIHKKVL
ncbi:MAG: CopG family antitoxin [Pseudomonadota bacterium]